MNSNNYGAVFCKNDKYFKGVKHMKLKYVVMKEKVQKQTSRIRTVEIQVSGEVSHWVEVKNLSTI